ncbi:EAL domain, c-di-GMP-specific phosphodiesterase class I (or its enzymatically inactive variant) [Parafrankia irregularis]|uniref:EAL domain, c-di-GMP-specific phosphodiesterase class I (Or its enzymatically inactive variant) n=1 Tax=Parafrankia irregularis TaxID=795642 RepID=A0A0S4QV61_9ACTN|nr:MULTISPECIES: EAL domain-containing protein [Parafrankia]MBE3204867.1 EAL domain-containing protein [Parafrankia sp. CH37]CUU59220.1 EAL domain, c-di-GMP-specific phosphodiesterase class I (or its enzymatically inactive variant) [Parafrankia irregularis]
MAAHHGCLGPRSEVCAPGDALMGLLDLLRRRLRMEIAWLGRLDGGLLILQGLSGNAQPFGLALGCTIRRDAGVFGRVLAGDLPELIPDTRRNPRTADIISVQDLGIGAYAATPILDTDGNLYGLVGCLHRHPQPSLGDRDIRFLRLLARFLTGYVSDLHRMWEIRSRVWHRVHTLIDSDGLRIHYQPVIDLVAGRTVGVEALTRLPDPRLSTAALFRDAAAAGLGPELETAVIQRALPALHALPDDVRLAVNAAPSTVTGGLVELLLDVGDPSRLVVEITEAEQAYDNPDLVAAVRLLRRHGVLIAIDDLGACYSGLEMLLILRPDVVKVDRVLIKNMSGDPVRRAIVAGITTIARETGCRVVAEGIETRADLTAAREAGIRCGQGYLLGRPTPDPRAACRSPFAFSALTRR